MGTRHTMILLISFIFGIGFTGCAISTSTNSVEGGYVFQHSMLNFSRTAAFPKRFLTPEPVVEESFTTSKEERVIPAKYEAGDFESESTIAKVLEGDSEVSKKEESAEVVEVDSNDEQREEVQLARATNDDDFDLGSILGESSRQNESDTTMQEPLSLQDNTPAFRQQVKETATTYLGVDGEFNERTFVLKVLKVNELEPGAGDSPDLRDLYKAYRNRGLTFDGEEPSIGDLVFFHNTRDVNSDSRNNDWYSACGVVTEVEHSGVVTFVAALNGKVQEFQMNLDRPEVRRDEAIGTVMNSHLRNKSLEDPEFTQYLAGELFAGFATLPVQ